MLLLLTLNTSLSDALLGCSGLTLCQILKEKQLVILKVKTKRGRPGTSCLQPITSCPGA